MTSLGVKALYYSMCQQQALKLVCEPECQSYYWLSVLHDWSSSSASHFSQIQTLMNSVALFLSYRISLCIQLTVFQATCVVSCFFLPQAEFLCADGHTGISQKLSLCLITYTVEQEYI